MVLSRCAGLFALSPVFGANVVPRTVKAGLAIVVAWVLAPGAAGWAGPTDLGGGALAAGMARECLVGLAMGLLASMVVVAAQMGAALLDMQMGLGVAAMLDPAAGGRGSAITRLAYFLAAVAVLASNGHHLLLQGLGESFVWLPVGQTRVSEVSWGPLVALLQAMTVAALRVAAPAVAMAFLADVMLAVLARVVPQANVFLVGFPLKIALGLFALAVSLPWTVVFLEQAFPDLWRYAPPVVRALGAG